MGGFDFTNQPSEYFGPRNVVVPASAGQLGVASTRTFVAGDGGNSDPASHWAGGAGGVVEGVHYDLIEFPLLFGLGDRMTSLIVDLNDTSGSNTMTVQLRFNNSAQFNNRLVSPAVVSAGDGTLQHIDMIAEIGFDVVINGPQLYSVVIWTNSNVTTTHRIFGLRYTIDHLPG